MRHLRDHVVLVALILLSGALFFFEIGTPGLFDADEPAYAQAAREMGESGDWVTPHFNGRPRFDKPPLFYYLILLSYRLFGVTEFAARFWSALAGVALTGMLWVAGRRWLGPHAGLMASAAFSASLLTALLARAAVTDMLLCLFVTAAILAGLAALQAPAPRARRFAIAGWVAMALAGLVKGPVGLLIPGLALGGSLLLLREIRSGLPRLVPWQGPALFLAIAAPWYALVLAANGWAFVEGFLIKHNLSRFSGVISSHGGPLWFYVPVLLVGFFPWCGSLPSALWRAARVARRRRAVSPAERLTVTCLCWFVGVFVFFSLAGTKLPSYLFPAFPALALLVGSGEMNNEKPTTDDRSMTTVDRSSVVGRRSSVAADEPIPPWVSRLGSWLIGLTGCALAAAFFLVPWIFEWARPAARGVLDGVPPPASLAWGLGGLVLAGTLAGLIAKGRRQPAVLAAMMAGLILTAAAAAPRAYAIVQGPLREFSEEARQILGPGDPVLVYGLNAPSVVFYANRRVTPLGSDDLGKLAETVRRLTDAGRPVVVITRSALAPRLAGVQGLSGVKSRGGYALYVSQDSRAARSGSAIR
ncbi:MAG: glycosyltransferase family 39 protein [candidate division NC10 bacterium]